MINLSALTVLITLAVGFGACAIILLLVLALKDYFKEELW